MKTPEKYRVVTGPFSSDESAGNNGCFRMYGPCNMDLTCMVSDGGGWEHVSVSCLKMKRLPNWIEMSFVKDLFWDETDCVMQLHPPHSEYVSNAEVLHLWRPIGKEIPLPPSIFVGIKGLDLEEALRG